LVVPVRSSSVGSFLPQVSGENVAQLRAALAARDCSDGGGDLLPVLVDERSSGAARLAGELRRIGVLALSVALCDAVFVYAFAVRVTSTEAFSVRVDSPLILDDVVANGDRLQALVTLTGLFRGFHFSFSSSWKVIGWRA
jgi:hypothetical protein